MATPGARKLTVAVGGLMHETNTFATSPTTYEDFLVDQQSPGLASGERMLEVVRGRHMAVSHFLGEVEERGHTVVPLAWTAPQPGGVVTDDAFERICPLLLDPLRGTRVDAVFIELHGAMVTESHDDAEAVLLERVRQVVGPDVPILATVDLHGNISRRSVELADYITGYREYPHVDWGLSGQRTAEALDQVVARGRRVARAHRRFDMIIPAHAGATVMEPARGVYDRLREVEKSTGVALSLMMGFPPADVAECGPTVFGYGDDVAVVEAAVAEVADAVTAAESAFAAHAVLDVADAVRQAIAASAGARGPVIIADTQDNAGAGATSSTTGLARELLTQQAVGSIVAICHEPLVAAQAHEAGVGGTIDAVLGVGATGPGQDPLAGRFRVVALSDGRFPGSGPMLNGSPVDLGRTAVIERDGVQLLLGSHRQQPLSRTVFTHLGIDPARRPIVGLKSTVHFRNDFADLASQILVAAAPGANPADPGVLPYRKVPSYVRRRLNPAANPAPARS